MRVGGGDRGGAFRSRAGRGRRGGREEGLAAARAVAAAAAVAVPSPPPFVPTSAAAALAASRAASSRDRDRGRDDGAGLALTRVGPVTLLNRYAVVKYLGRGACGRVYLVLDAADGGLYAAKVVKRPRAPAAAASSAGAANHPRPTLPPPSASPRAAAATRDLRREVALMRRGGRHPNIVSLREVVDDPAGGRALLVMDYAEGGPVLPRADLDRGRRLAEPVARSAFRGALAGLAHLHARRVVHGDVKPENVLLTACGRALLSDFGCASLARPGPGGLDAPRARVGGTPAFLAPEATVPAAVYRGRPADAYALGATLFTLAFGRIPHAAPSVAALFRAVRADPLRFPADVPASAELKDLLCRMMDKDPAARLTLAGAAAHPWTRGAGRAAGVPRGLPPAPPNPPDTDAALAAVAGAPPPPRVDRLLAELASPDAPRVEFPDGAALAVAGDPATHVHIVLSGTVEILLSPGADGGANPPVDGVAARALPPDVAAAVARATDLAKLLERGSGRYVVAHRRAGAFVGDASALAPRGVALTTARAVGPVVALAIPVRALKTLVDVDPEARQQAKRAVWGKAAERLVVEALARLAAVGDALARRAPRAASAKW